MNDSYFRFSSYLEIDGKYSKPSIQRSIMPEQIGRMKIHILEQYELGECNIFGAISLAKLNNILYVVDGQHRLQAIKEIYTEKKLNIPFNAIIYNINTKEQMKKIFNTINNGIPLPDFLIEDISENKKDKLRDINDYISKRKGFSDTKKNRPNINTLEFMNKLNNSKFANLIINLDDFIKAFDYINYSIKENIKNPNYIKKEKITSNMLEKCREFDNYVSLDRSYDFLENEDILEKIDSLLRDRKHTIIDEGKNIIENGDNIRKKFNTSERQQIWHTYIGPEKGRVKCPLCKANNIEPLNFIIGHVKSLYNGGNNNNENLRPICAVCNSSMGTKNIDLDQYTLEGI
jgi:hypothetical protein